MRWVCCCPSFFLSCVLERVLLSAPPPQRRPSPSFPPLAKCLPHLTQQPFPHQCRLGTLYPSTQLGINNSPSSSSSVTLSYKFLSFPFLAFMRNVFFSPFARSRDVSLTLHCQACFYCFTVCKLLRIVRVFLQQISRSAVHQENAFTFPWYLFPVL